MNPKSRVAPEGGDDIQHKDLEDVYPLQKLETSPEVRLSFIAKEPGIYKVLWSNTHSWFKSKTLSYKVLVLTPALS